MPVDETIGALEAFVGEQMRLGQTPGLAISAWRDGQPVLQRGYGAADLAAGTPMTERTGVVIGSTTKALTCVALLQLVARGVLDLDVPVQRYLPSFRLADPDQAARITLRQAITHTAGLPATRSDRGEFLFNDDAADDALARSVDALAARVPIGPPGGEWVYANDGYALAGRVIEVVAGQQYEAYMRQHVFEPLGFTDTFFSNEVPAGAEVAVAHDFDAAGAPYASFFPHNRAGAAAGSQLVMSARDAARWLDAVLRGGAGERGMVLGAEGFTELLRPQVSIQAGVRGSDGASSRYALGWMVGPIDGFMAISHGGSTITMGSHFLLVPERRLAVAVLANSSSEVNAIVAEGIASILLGRAPGRSFPVVDPAYVPDRSSWPRLQGVYEPQRAQNSVPAPLPIEYDGTGLRGRTYPADGRRRAGDIFLRPTGDLSFVLSGRGRTGGTASFTIGEDAVEASWMGVPLGKAPMRRMRMALSDERLAQIVESTVVEYRWSYEGERAEVIDTGDALIQALQVPSGVHGFAGRFRLSPIHAGERLDQLLAQAEEGGRRFLWITSPSSEPSDVSDLLVSRGIPRTIVWDGLVLRDLRQEVRHGGDVVVEPLSNQNVEEYARMCACDSGDEHTYPERLAAARRLVGSGQREAQVFVGRIDGQAAGCAVLRIETEGIAYLRNAFTVAAFRRRGVYLALVAARLAVARGAGCTAAVVQAQIQSSALVLRKRGFEPVCRLYGHMRL